MIYCHHFDRLLLPHICPHHVRHPVLPIAFMSEGAATLLPIFICSVSNATSKTAYTSQP